MLKSMWGKKQQQHGSMDSKRTSKASVVSRDIFPHADGCFQGRTTCPTLKQSLRHLRENKLFLNWTLNASMDAVLRTWGRSSESVTLTTTEPWIKIIIHNINNAEPNYKRHTDNANKQAASEFILIKTLRLGQPCRSYSLLMKETWPWVPCSETSQRASLPSRLQKAMSSHEALVPGEQKSGWWMKKKG